MTEQPEPTEPAEQVTQGGSPDPTEQVSSNDSPEPTDRPSREAAKYRTQLREAEAQRDGLAEQVTAMQRAEVERLAASKLVKPAGVWSNGATVDALLDDDGHVDPAKVSEAVAAAIATNGLASIPKGPIIPGQGRQPEKPVKMNGWEQAFGPPAL